MKMMLIANSVASSYSARRRVVIRKALAADCELTAVETEYRGHATELAAQAAADGFDVVVVLAGDGTLNEAAGGLVGTQTALAPLPGGSTNVYAQALGVPLDPVDAASVLIQSLETESSTRIGVGKVNDRHFLFHCGVGFDAAVIRQVEKYGKLKRHAAHPVYVLAAFDTWFRGFDRKEPAFDIELANGDRIDGVYFAIIHKMAPYTYLGHRPINVDRTANLHTPLSLTAFTKCDVITLMGSAASAMGSGRFLRSRKSIKRHTDLESFTIAGRKRFPRQVDGDDLGDTMRLEVQHIPDAITLITPYTSLSAPTSAN